MKKVFVILLAFTAFAACQIKVENKVYGKGEVVSVGVNEFSRTIADSAVQLVDVRTAEEFTQGTIPGSVNIDVNSGDFGVTADSLLDKNRTVAIFCRSGRRSKKAAEILSLNGFNVVELDKGYNSWVEAGK